MSVNSLNQASEKEAWCLEQWLTYLNEIHPNDIELGLERVSNVFKNLAISFENKTVVTVAGTNGKGTTCAFVEQALLLAGHSVGVFSSPHILDYRERVRVAGGMLSEEAHCKAFLQVERARTDVPLTYFEFGTLAALLLLADAKVDYLLLEVGLGGRLDAVNIVDPDLAVITSIDLDHQDWLGDTKDAIAKEKAGIFRKGIPVVIGEPEPPATLLQAADDFKVQAVWQGQDFDYHAGEQGFYWQGKGLSYDELPVPNIPPQNASTAIQVLQNLGIAFNFREMAEIISKSSLPGRRQIIQTHPTVMLDVAHNPQATSFLASDIRNYGKRVIAVVGMLADKDIVASLSPIAELVSVWHCANLNVPRGASANKLVSALSSLFSTEGKVVDFLSIEQAYLAALKIAKPDDLIVVFGSFFAVADVLKIVKED